MSLTGVVRDAATGRGVPNAEVECISSPNTGRGSRTDANGAYRIDGLTDGAMWIKASAAGYAPESFSIPSARDALNFTLTAYQTFLYSGTVRDGRGRAVPGATVEGADSISVTDANGHYEFSSRFNSVAGRVRTPDGYEPKPVSSTMTFPLEPGQNITVRRITRVSVWPPATVPVSDGTDRRSVRTEVEFDTGQVESPHVDAMQLSSSDPSVLKAAVVAGSAYVEGVKLGSAQVTGRYFGVLSAPQTVQVIPR
ncbi:MAG TPA: carboxypeptidase-like regulatory domain-containing protein [Vicinamibacterales bacterium]|nr:carboxypeptidase-like regulatory domain-containing protein [Vicinamibacterales bacterium]